MAYDRQLNIMKNTYAGIRNINVGWVMLTLAVIVVIIHCLKLSILNTHNFSIHTCISISITCASQASNSWPFLITTYRSTLKRGPRPPPPLIGIPLLPLPLQTQKIQKYIQMHMGISKSCNEWQLRAINCRLPLKSKK